MHGIPPRPTTLTIPAFNAVFLPLLFSIAFHLQKILRLPHSSALNLIQIHVNKNTNQKQMVERKEGDVRIYIISILFFACIIAGGVFLCLSMFRPESESEPWYPVAGMILVGIPWMFWIATYLYRCGASCCCQSNNGGNVNGFQSSSTKTQSYASAGPTTRSVSSSDNEDSPLKSPHDDQRHVHFGEVVVLGDQNHHGGGESPHEDAKGYPETQHEFGGNENSHDSSIASDKDYVSAAYRKGEAPLMMSDST